MQEIENQSVSLEEYLLLKKNFDELQAKFAMLQHELAQLKRLIFGAKTERFVPSDQAAQLDLFSQNSQNPPPPELPRIEIRLEPAADTAGWRHIGDEITEELEFLPGRFFVRKFVRPKFARPDFEAEIGARSSSRRCTAGRSKKACPERDFWRRFWSENSPTTCPFFASRSSSNGRACDSPTRL